MKKVIAFVVSFLILFAMLYAHGKDSAGINIKDDSKCLQFQIGSDFQLSSFQGSTISFKKHISNSRAYRIGFTISGNIEDRNDFTNFDNDSLDRRQIRNIYDFGINLTGQYLKYVPYENTYLYYGCGPQIIFSKTYQKSWLEVHTTGDWEPSSLASKNYDKIFQIGLVLVAGVEYFLSKSISIHGEYSQEVSYRYYWYKPSSGPNHIYHKYSFDSGGVKFGCSFYL